MFAWRASIRSVQSVLAEDMQGFTSPWLTRQQAESQLIDMYGPRDLCALFALLADLLIFTSGIVSRKSI